MAKTLTGSELKAYLKKRFTTPAEMARAAGVSRAYASYIFNEERNVPSIKVLDKIGISVVYEVPKG